MEDYGFFFAIYVVWLQYWRIGDKKLTLANFLAPIFLEPEQPLIMISDIKRVRERQKGPPLKKDDFIITSVFAYIFFPFNSPENSKLEYFNRLMFSYRFGYTRGQKGPIT